LVFDIAYLLLLAGGGLEVRNETARGWNSSGAREAQS
jgi:hypothetical protein